MSKRRLRDRDRFRTRSNRDRGAAAVELAVVTLLLVPIAAGTIDGSYLLYSRRNNADAARAGARAAVQPCVGSINCLDANPTDADENAVLALGAHLNRQSTKVKRVIVYRASSANSGVPSACLTSSTGVGGICNVYNGPITAAGLNMTASTNWAASSRNRAPDSADYLGVYTEFDFTAPIGLVFPKQQTIASRAVFRLESLAKKADELPDLPHLPLETNIYPAYDPDNTPAPTPGPAPGPVTPSPAPSPIIPDNGGA